MTLVGLDSSSSSSNLVSMMLSVQQSQYQQSSVGHRGNVIVANNNNNNNNNNSSSSSSDLAKMQAASQQQQQQQKKKMYGQSTPYSDGGQQPASVARRNARERNRVKQVNNGFATLRQHIPQSLAQALGSNTAGTQGGARAGSKKLSKVETLRMAVTYIRNLQQLLDEHDAEHGGGGGASLDSSPEPLKFELKSESGDEQRYSQRQPTHGQSPVYAAASAGCSEASSSPTPSFASDSSSQGGPAAPSYGANFTTTIYPAADGYDYCEPISPGEEVLLDYISNSYMWSHAQ